MKKFVLILFLITLPLYLIFSIYFLDKHYFLCPVEYQGNVIIRCDSRGNGFFGSERSGKRLHEGVDLLSEIGTPVFASRWGWVIAAARNRGMGKYIVIRHLDNITTIYGHLSEIYVRKYSLVRQGQIIGKVGKTGNANYQSIAPHLHFEVRRAGIPQDPLEYLQ